MTQFLSLLLNGLSLGAIYALIALGFVLIYKGTGVINFAMGEFMMLGAYFFYTANVRWGLPLPGALLLGSQSGDGPRSFAASLRR